VTKRQIPAEGTHIWVWVREAYHRVGIGPVKCCVGKHWHGRDVLAHELSGKGWAALDNSAIFSESLSECFRLGMERETEHLQRLKFDFERQAEFIAKLKADWPNEETDDQNRMG